MMYQNCKFPELEMHFNHVLKVAVNRAPFGLFAQGCQRGGETLDATLTTLRCNSSEGPFYSFHHPVNNPYCIGHPVGNQARAFSMGNELCAHLHKHVEFNDSWLLCNCEQCYVPYRVKVGLGCPTRPSMILSMWTLRSLSECFLLGVVNVLRPP